jgi:hypothetical protein
MSGWKAWLTNYLHAAVAGLARTHDWRDRNGEPMIADHNHGKTRIPCFLITESAIRATWRFSPLTPMAWKTSGEEHRIGSLLKKITKMYNMDRRDGGVFHDP